LLTDVLRKEWGFKGYVVSDYGAVGGILGAHHTAANEEGAAAQAINAGMDMEYPGVYIWGEPLKKAVQDGLVSMKTLDEAVSRVLRVKLELGLFEDPFVDPATAERVVNSPAHKALALEAARQAIVLLKNDNGTLPFSKNVKSVAVIGPLANGPVPLGGYSGDPGPRKSVLDAIRESVPGAKVLYAHGADLGSSAKLPPIPQSAFVPPSGEGNGLKAEYFANRDLQGPPALERVDQNIDFDWGTGSPDPKLPVDDYSIRWTGYLVPEETGDCDISLTSDDGIRLFLDGKKVAEYWVERPATSDLVRVHLEAGKRVPIRVEYYEAKGFASASLGWSVGPSVDREVQEAVDAAKQADAVVVVAGIAEGEGQDRAYLDLPGRQDQVIRAVAATGKPLAVVLLAGSPVTMRSWVGDAGAIVDAWYPGQEGATAIAEVLFGDVNPGGKLPITFPQTIGQCPIYYNLKPSGRGYDYVDSSGRPQFPFGHGLSYTEFRYSNLTVSPSKGSASDKFTVEFDVENAGKMKGDEVPQLYIHDVVASIVRPLKELAAFERVTLAPGQKKHVTFTLRNDQLSFLDAHMKPVVEPGEFEVFVGSSSDDIRLSGKFEVAK
jgi:beta-glucosidase